MGWLCHCIEAGYLYGADRPWPGLWSIAGMILVTMLGLALAWWWGDRLRRQKHSLTAARVAMVSLLLGLILYLVQPLWRGPMAARIVFLTPSTLGILAPLLAIALSRPWPAPLGPPLCALACDLHPEGPTWPWRWQIPWLALHGLSLYVLVVYEDLGWWPVALASSCLALAAGAQWMARRQPGGHLLRTELLTPLLLPAFAYLGRWLGRNPCGMEVEQYAGYPYADLLSPWFDCRAMLYAGIAAMVLATMSLCWRACRSAWSAMPGNAQHEQLLAQPHLGHILGAALLILGLGWYAAMAAKHLSHGATGSDPFCYLQMAVDLAERGTALHRFPLAGQGYSANLPLWPLVPVGYHPPGPDGWAATVWSIGWPLLLAPFYRLGSEGALLWAAPVMVISTALLAWAWARALWPAQSLWIGGLAGALILTSREVVWRSLVPMADAAAMALATLAMLALVRAQQRNSLCWSAVAGLALGMGYWVRHPLLPLCVAALPLVIGGRWTLRRRVVHALVLGGAALSLALLDLRYHAHALGSPWTPESPEAALLSWRHIGSGLGLFLDQGLLGRYEFGFLLPLIVYGAWLQARQPAERPQTVIMALAFGGVLLFGLSYRALRLRDLLALFPWLALWFGRGWAGLWARANAPQQGRIIRRAALLMLVWVALSARTTWTLQRLQDPQISTFGYLSAAQRRAYDQLVSLVPEDAVVACSLNAGAIARYTGRETVRPAAWSEDDFQRFAHWLAQEDRPLYAVQDGSEMAQWLSRARAAGHSFSFTSTLNLPTFDLGGEPYRPGATVYRLTSLD
jgi:hypothetical protein